MVFLVFFYFSELERVQLIMSAIFRYFCNEVSIAKCCPIKYIKYIKYQCLWYEVLVSLSWCVCMSVWANSMYTDDHNCFLWSVYISIMKCLSSSILLATCSFLCTLHGVLKQLFNRRCATQRRFVKSASKQLAQMMQIIACEKHAPIHIYSYIFSIKKLGRYLQRIFLILWPSFT